MPQVTQQQILDKLQEEGVTNLDALAQKAADHVNAKSAESRPTADVSALLTVSGNILFTT